jgi:preprotein translocase subunit SecA
MLKSIVNRVFGSRHDRERRRVQPIVDAINEHYERLQGVSEEELRGQTARFRELLHERTADLEARATELRTAKRATTDTAEREAIDAELSGLDGRGGVEGELRATIAEVLDEILPEAFATVRAAARRLVGTAASVTGGEQSWDMVHYDVQLNGGVQLHLGKIAEMATGEGKTLVATLPLYLNALPGRGAHLVTVNNYLARRDSQWMGHLYRYLGLSVGCIDDTEPGTPDRRAAYECDITYGTNNEFGFDYLRDNMVNSLDQRVQRPHWYAIVDEVDSVLIDEARTPLIISGPVGTRATRRTRTTTTGSPARAPAGLAGQRPRGRGRAGVRAEGHGERVAAPVQGPPGAPKNKRLLKVMQESGVKQMVQKMELDHIADRKLPASKQQYRDLEEDLLYVLDERGHTVHLTDRGVDALAPDNHDEFVLPDISLEVHRIEHDHEMEPQEKLEARRAVELEYARRSETLHVVHQLLRAYSLYEKDVNYVVTDGQVLIVDEFTGRTMPGRRWSEGLHQAVEAKERVQVKGETQTLATITIQNYFRLYEKLAGMTGTAETRRTSSSRSTSSASRDPDQPGHRARRPAGPHLQDAAREVQRDRRGDAAPARPRAAGARRHDERRGERDAVAPVPARGAQAPGPQREAERARGRDRGRRRPAGRDHDRDEHGRPRHRHQARARRHRAAPERVKDLDGNDVDVVEDGGLHIIGSERHESRPHRPAAARPRRPPGRPGRVAVLPVARGRPDAALRVGAHRPAHGPHGRAGRRGAHAPDDHALDRGRAEARGAAELPEPQAAARVRRRDEPAARGGLLAAVVRARGRRGAQGRGAQDGRARPARRVENAMADFDPENPDTWDPALLRQDLLMHYLVQVPELEPKEDGAEPERPTSAAEVQESRARRASPRTSASSPSSTRCRTRPAAASASGCSRSSCSTCSTRSGRTTCTISTSCARRSTTARGGRRTRSSSTSRRPYTMFVDLMNDLASTFTERFLKAQLVFDPIPTSDPYAGAIAGGYGDGQQDDGDKPKRRYNALGILEDIPESELFAGATGSNGAHDGAGDGAGVMEALYDEEDEDVEDLATGEPQA